ncbi:MAG TPA: lysophospholipid acyltransferase family protein [Myxococcaceae bacterium]
MARPLVTPGGPLATVFAGLAVGLLRALPRRWLLACARGAGRLAMALGIRRAVTLDNLARAFPEKPPRELHAIAAGAYTNMAMAAVEGLVSTRGPEPSREVTVENYEVIQAALDRGQGVLVAMAHLGSWEVLGELMAQRGVPLHAVVRPLKGAFNAILMKARMDSGLKLIPARGAIRGAVQALQQGGVVVMLVDQVLPNPSAVFVPFFGRLAATSPALSAAAMRSGAPVFAASALRDGDAIRCRIEGPFPVPDSGNRHQDLVDHTAAVTAAIEGFIRRAPEQWLWLHRRWKVAPPEAGPPTQRAGADPRE